MRSSDDGLTWTGVHGGFPEKHIRALAAGSGRFLAGTDGGGLYVSTDRGESWTAKPVWMGAGSSAFLQFAHAHGTFVAFAATGGACYLSTDSGDTWTACAAPVKASASFAFDETHLQWVAPVSGGYATSADAKTWVAHTASNVPRELAFDSARGHWFGRSGGTWYRGDTLDMFTRTAMNVSDYRAWALGDIPLTGIAMSGELCEDKR
jgi:Ni/Co efflux regulator RcnB